MTSGFLTRTLFVAFLLTSCSDPHTSVAPNASPLVWTGSPVVMGSAPSPIFPSSLRGWRLSTSWNDLPRLFSDSGWTNLSGPDYTDFPTTMNGCRNQRFLIRWRALDSTAQIEAGIARGGSVTANAGWMGIDGCETPQFRVVSISGGNTLTDVTVDVQRWTPAP